jgi:poly(3-hydroxybutyrate) depolymerase
MAPVVRRVVLGADPEQEYFLFVPSSGGHEAPVLVAVHGISRNAREQAKLFSSQCENLGVVLVAPYFPMERYADYQRLGRAGRGRRADHALDAIIEEVEWSTGACATPMYLFGYSGGAQFVHRYTMAYPHRVARAVVASAGWYTLPKPRRRFPHGIRPSRELPGVRFDAEEFLRVPITVIVGDRDTRGMGLRRNARVNRQQGKTRVARARNWVQAMWKAAEEHRLEPRVSYEEIPGGGHSFPDLMKRGRLGARVFEALFEPPSTRAARRGNGNS